MRQCHPQDAIVSPTHFQCHGLTGRLMRREPDQIECILRGRAVTVAWDDKREGHRMLTRIVIPGHRGIWEVLNDRERRGSSGDPWQRDRSEILLDVTNERITDSLAVQHTTGHECPGDLTIGSLAKQQAHGDDAATIINADRNGIDVHHRYTRTGTLQIVGVQPGRPGIQIRGAHGVSLPCLDPVAAYGARVPRSRSWATTASRSDRRSRPRTIWPMRWFVTQCCLVLLRKLQYPAVMGQACSPMRTSGL